MQVILLAVQNIVNSIALLTQIFVTCLIPIKDLGILSSLSSQLSYHYKPWAYVSRLLTVFVHFKAKYC